MDEVELKSIIARELEQALGRDGTKLSTDRRDLLKYYEAEPFGNEVEGRSSVVMHAVQETVDWVLPALLRIFTVSDKLVEYEPTTERDEEAADQATQYGNYIINRDNPGFMVLHDWFKDALIQKLGWIKVYWNEQKSPEINTFEGLSEAEYQGMLADPNVEVVEERKYPAPQPGGFNEDAPEIGAPVLYDCKLKVTRTEGRIRIENCPPEEVLHSPRAKRNAPLPFVCHRREWRYTDLLEQGYDEDTLDLACFDESPEYNTERIERYQREQDWPYYDERTDKPMREIWVEENYIRVDIDGDGLAELCKVVTAANGAIILTKGGKPDIEQIDEVPLISLCPIPMPHKLVGLSVADLVTDLQLIKSVLVRQILDNLYLANNAGVIVGEAALTDDTYDDLLTSRPNRIVRARDHTAIVPFVTPFVGDKAMPIVEYFDQVGETRTGVERRNQSLDSDIINKSSSGVQTHLLQQQAAQRVELIARIFAETGIRDLAQMILGMVTKYQQRERVIRLTGNWVTMDPRQWKNSMQVSVNVGLGTGNKDQMLQHLMTILQVQQNILMAGAKAPGFSGLVTPKNVYDVTERLTENAGFKESFFTDPTSQPPQQGPPPDPEMMKAQHGMQLDQQKAQVETQIAQQRMQADVQIQQQKAQQEAQLEAQRAQFQVQLEQKKAEHAMQLEMQRESAKADLARYEIDARARAGAYTPGPAPGASAPV